METSTTVGTVDEYISAFPTEVRERLEVVRALVREVAPAATETISYGMPTFKEHGATLVHFAAFQNHIGLYGASRAAEVFADEIGKNKTTKGSIQFPSNEPLPLELIRKIVEFRVREARERLAERKVAKARKRS
ncbi:MAG: iron chaperone [Dehalococcoidia bacterium]